MYDLTLDRRKFERRGKVARKVDVVPLSIPTRNRRSTDRRQDQRPLSAFPYLPFCEL